MLFETHMLLTLGVLVAVIVVLSILGLRVPRGGKAHTVWMSQQWLDEHRKTHSS